MGGKVVENWRARFPRRTVHLDFHTGPGIPDVGADFDASVFARRFADSDVDSVTLFAKCHHGHLYYATERPERHPSLAAGLDLLGEQIGALHEAEIRAPIYLSVQCDEYAANHHPEWRALTPDRAQVRRPDEGPFQAGWQILDMSSPYQDYLVEQLEEVLERYAPVDGIFLDMCWDQPSSSHWAMDGMRAAGLDPADPGDQATYAREVALRYMARFSALVEPALVPGSPTGTWFNSRPKANLVEERKFLRHIEVEALPTGGWGYSYLPFVGRLVRTLGLPVLSQTGRFHRSWGDGASLKSEAALKYECCQILAQGFSNGVGDLLGPRGVPNAAVYRRIGEVYRHIKKCEPYVLDAPRVTEVALVADPRQGDSPAGAAIGAVRALQRLRHQFDVVPTDGPLDGYAVVVVPEGIEVGNALAERLSRFVAAGGSLVISACGPDANGQRGRLVRRFGARIVGTWPYDPVFLGLTAPGLVHPAPGIDVRVPGESARVEALEGTEVLVDLVLPYFQRRYDHFSGHSYTPPDKSSGHGAVLQHGKVIILAVPLLSAMASEANLEYLDVLGACLARLLPRPVLRAGGPSHLETAVVRADRHVAVHLLSFIPAPLGRDLDLVVDPVPVVACPVSVRMEAAPGRAHLQPDGQALALRFADGYASTEVTVLGGHGLVVFD
jgi:hypothetical protein